MSVNCAICNGSFRLNLVSSWSRNTASSKCLPHRRCYRQSTMINECTQARTTMVKLGVFKKHTVVQCRRSLDTRGPCIKALSEGSQLNLLSTSVLMEYPIRSNRLSTVSLRPSSSCLPLPFISRLSSRCWWCVLPSNSMSCWPCSLGRRTFITSSVSMPKVSLIACPTGDQPSPCP